MLKLLDSGNILRKSQLKLGREIYAKFSFILCLTFHCFKEYLDGKKETSMLNTGPEILLVNMSFTRGFLSYYLSSYMDGFFLTAEVCLEWNLFINSNAVYKQSKPTTNLCKVIFLHLLFVLHLQFDFRGILMSSE